MVEAVDLQLIERMRAGDKSAFAQLLDHNIGPLSNYVSRMTGHAAETEDIVQETFIRLWQKRDRFDPDKSKLTTWLHRIAHNLCVDHFRKQQRLEYTDIPEASVAGPDLDFGQTETSKQVKGALMKLSDRQRSALVLFHYQELSNNEIAAILEISTDAVESLIRRSRERLKQLLENSEDNAL